MTLDLIDDEKAALISVLAGIIENDHFPLSPRIQQLRRILAKLRDDPGPGTPEREETKEPLGPQLTRARWR